MQLDNETMRELLHSTLAEKLEHLRGVAKKKKKPLGRKLKVLPGESYTAPESEAEEDEDNDEEEEATLDSPAEMEESDSEELPEVTSVRYRKPQAQAGGDQRILELTVGSYVAVVYQNQWYIAQVEGEEEEMAGYNSCSTWTSWGPTSSSGGRSQICCAPQTRTSS